LRKLLALAALIVAICVAGITASEARAGTNVYVYCNQGPYHQSIYCNVTGYLYSPYGLSVSCGGYGCTLAFPYSSSGWGTACGAYGCKSFNFGAGGGAIELHW
jgi:hypothetical protein